MLLKKFFKTNSSGQTKKAASFFAKKIFSKDHFLKGALVLALSGDLGSGKTNFVQGFLRSVGVGQKIISPTFILIKRYGLRKKKYESAYHVDCYRIKKSRELSALGLAEIFNNPKNIVLIEWPERVKKFLPKNAAWIRFEHGEKESERNIRIN